MPLFLVHHSKRVVLVTAPTIERARELAPAIAISFEFRQVSNPVGRDLDRGLRITKDGAFGAGRAGDARE